MNGMRHKKSQKNRTTCHKSTLSRDEYSKGAFLEEVVIGATSAADPLSCIVERRISNEAKTIPKQIHFDAAYAGNAFDTVPYRSLCRGYGG
jgi:hypothetical protein